MHVNLLVSEIQKTVLQECPTKMFYLQAFSHHPL